jgi:ribonuclease Y
VNPVIQVVITVLVAIIAAAAGVFVSSKIYFNKGVEHRKKESEALIGSAEKEAERILDSAKKEANTKAKAAVLEVKDEIHKLRSDADKEIRERRSDISRQERQVQRKEDSLDKKLDSLDKKEEQLQRKIATADANLKQIEEERKRQSEILERISELTKEQAKEYLLNSLEHELTHEKAVLVANYEQQIRDNCEEQARKYIALAISKCAADQVSESAVSVVTLPNEEMKGRIIGREGRNIRTLETLTGVDLIVDDTPEAITISCFDHIRREIAALALEKLIADGRIHPTRIEEMVEKSKREVEHKIRQEGERAVLETNVHGVHPELIKLLGRLYYRTSYRQNVLQHSIEVAQLAGVLASEIGVDPNMARRAGLLHDVGKALTAEIEGSHVQIGVDVCKKYKENREIIHAIEAHHNDIEPQTVIACIVQAADAISAARPGARSENYENYIKRLEKLEEICTSYEGVENCYALQAGREIRVMVQPDVINDDNMVLLARQIAQQIEAEMDYPGQIKVNMIRESRVTDYAK